MEALLKLAEEYAAVRKGEAHDTQVGKKRKGPSGPGTSIRRKKAKRKFHSSIKRENACVCRPAPLCKPCHLAIAYGT